MNLASFFVLNLAPVSVGPGAIGALRWDLWGIYGECGVRRARRGARGAPLVGNTFGPARWSDQAPCARLSRRLPLVLVHRLSIWVCGGCHGSSLPLRPLSDSTPPLVVPTHSKQNGLDHQGALLGALGDGFERCGGGKCRCVHGDVRHGHPVLDLEHKDGRRQVHVVPRVGLRPRVQ